MTHQMLQITVLTKKLLYSEICVIESNKIALIFNRLPIITAYNKRFAARLAEGITIGYCTTISYYRA